MCDAKIGGRGAAPRPGRSAFVSRCHGGLGARQPLHRCCSPPPGQQAQPRGGTSARDRAATARGRRGRSVMAVKGGYLRQKVRLEGGFGLLEGEHCGRRRAGRAGPGPGGGADARRLRPGARSGCAPRHTAGAAPAHPPSPGEEPAAWAGPGWGRRRPEWSPPAPSASRAGSLGGRWPRRAGP